MSDEIEYGICDFCKEMKPVERTYVYPSKYTKPTNPEEYLKLYNEGNFFIYISTCAKCGPPKTKE
jgi:hypothetical protein